MGVSFSKSWYLRTKIWGKLGLKLRTVEHKVSWDIWVWRNGCPPRILFDSEPVRNCISSLSSNQPSSENFKGNPLGFCSNLYVIWVLLRVSWSVLCSEKVSVADNRNNRVVHKGSNLLSVQSLRRVERFKGLTKKLERSPKNEGTLMFLWCSLLSPLISEGTVVFL